MLMFLRILAIVFGLFELVNNVKYLKQKDGIRKAYGQHREIPSTVSENIMYTKVKIMLTVGCIFVTGSVVTILLPTYTKEILSYMYTAYALYAWAEAIYYKRHALGYVLAVFISIISLLSWFVV